MVKKKHVRFIQVLCLGALMACQPKSSPPPQQMAPTVAPSAPTAPPATNADSAPSPAPSPAYGDALNLASGAVTLGQQATSLDDWSLIVGRWQRAIDKLKQVPKDDPNHGAAQEKLTDYNQYLTQAKQRLQRLQQPPPEIPLARSVPPPQARSPQTAPEAFLEGTNATVPIIERRGGTPVINVTFNGKPYPMILDTGASHTHLPRTMANQLRIPIVGSTTVATASNNQVLVDVGIVDSIRVGTIQRRDLPVSIGDAVPIGLLGNDVYGDYDVILQINSVEFRPR